MKNMMFLVIITDLHLGTKRKFSGICFEKTIDNFQHGSFAGSVVSDQCHTFATFDIKRNIGEQSLSRKCLGEFLHMQDIVST